MIWLTWRESRAQVAALSGAIAALLAFLALTAANLPSFGNLYLVRLQADHFASGMFVFGSIAVMVLPALVGIFWGAPLVARELEAGTHRLAWNQSVTRTRWLATKLAVTAAAAAVVTGALSLGMTWWAHSIDAAVNAGQQQEGPLGLARISPAMFDARGIAPIGFALFALAVGGLAGIVVRRVVPAMAITLALFVVVQVAMPLVVRGHLGPTTTVVPITANTVNGMMASIGPGNVPRDARDLRVKLDQPGSWVIANETLDPHGTVIHELPAWFALCVPAQEFGLGPGPDPQASAACFARVAREGYEQRVAFLPASRYWTLQAIEVALFLALAGLLTAGSFWWLRHRVT